MVPAPVQKVRHRLRLQQRNVQPAVWLWLLPGVFVAGGTEFHGNAQLAGCCKVKLYSTPLVVAEGKALLFCQRYPGNLCAALGARHDVAPPRAYRRGGPETKIAHKKLALEF